MCSIKRGADEADDREVFGKIPDDVAAPGDLVVDRLRLLVRARFRPVGGRGGRRRAGPLRRRSAAPATFGPTGESRSITEAECLLAF